MCVARRLVSVFILKRLPLQPPVCAGMCVHFLSHLFLGEWQLVAVAVMQLAEVAATLDASWDLLMDCFSWGGQLCHSQGVQWDELSSSCM
jgi:hypothetical protein